MLSQPKPATFDYKPVLSSKNAHSIELAFKTIKSITNETKLLPRRKRIKVHRTVVHSQSNDTNAVTTLERRDEKEQFMQEAANAINDPGAHCFRLYPAISASINVFDTLQMESKLDRP
jgi:hypothetical protein